MAIMSRHVDVWSLDVFVSVVELGSISKAATVHGLSQPAVSTRVAKLERLLGLRLLERGAGGSRPTHAGVLVAGWSRATLDAASQLLAGADSLRKDAAQKVHLAASFTIAEFLLPGWLHAFAKVDASVRFSVDVANSRRVMERVLARDVDMGFVEDEIDDDRLSSAVVARDELVIVVAPKHPWARRDEVPARALAETALVLREEGSGTRQTLDRALASLGLSRSVPPLLELGSTAAVKQAVRSGAGPAVLSRLAVGTELEAGALCVVRVPEVELGRSLHAVWTGPAPGSPASARLLGRLAQPAGTAPALRSR